MEQKAEVTKVPPIATQAYRWVLTVKDGNPDVHSWCVKVHVDYISKYLTADFIDDTKGEVFAWLEFIKNPNTNLDMVLTHYDQHNRPNSTLEFSGCDLVAHTAFYDYGNTEPLVNHVIFRYKKTQRRNGLHIN
jgi:hypothetical protein